MRSGIGDRRSAATIRSVRSGGVGNRYRHLRVPGGVGGPGTAGRGVLTRMPAARSPVLVGRQAELATALQLLHAAGRGEGSTLLVTGEAGIGKSRLLAELARRAPEASMTVLR